MALSRYHSLLNNSNCTSAHLQLYTDFNASRTQMWPTLGRTVRPFKCEPSVKGIYCEPSKPSNVAELLVDYIKELWHLLWDGLRCIPERIVFDVLSVTILLGAFLGRPRST
ncbi:hypothetical protein PHET_01142 [Paragonimus heterotremus]|uniref:Uncharacterized protein n=1 Tax=Paragonimus heterotremus TaxID=100268 RepID=A0A8J4WKN9_9TREM|nr:hypothetical protein PHET_01142 [Paragonimus heterotremus]